MKGNFHVRFLGEGVRGNTASLPDFKDREDRTTLQFRPVMADLDHEEAEILAIQLKEQLLRERRDQRGINTDAGVYPAPDFDL